MEPLPERLRILSETKEVEPISAAISNESIYDAVYHGHTAQCDLFNKWADEIEQNYISKDIWPCFEDGEPVMVGDMIDDKKRGVVKVSRISIIPSGFYFNESKPHNENNRPDDLVYEHGEPVKRPQPKVLDADGKEIKVGDVVWNKPCVRDNDKWWSYPLKVIDITDTHVIVRHPKNSSFTMKAPQREFTHTEPDSWEKLECDANKVACKYFGHPLDTYDGCKGCAAFNVSFGDCERFKMEDVLRRAKALSERDV